MRLKPPHALCALLSLWPLTACKSLEESRTMGSTASSGKRPAGAPDLVRFPRRTVRALPASKACLSRVFRVNTNIFPDLGSSVITDKEEDSVFRVDESRRPLNAYWMAAASLLAYEDEATVRRELGAYWGARDVTWLSVTQAQPTLDVQAFVADIPHDPASDLPARDVDIGITVVSERARASVGDMMIVAFRGTETAIRADIHTDLRNKAVPFRGAYGDKTHVHQGFQESLDAVWDKAVAAVRGAGRPVWVTGHSLGAGVATLFAARAMALGDPKVRIAGLYTFGSPRVGLGDFVQAFNDDAKAKGLKLRRYVNKNDIVVQIPEHVTGVIGNGLSSILTGGWKHVGVASGDADALVWYAKQRVPYANDKALERMATNVWVSQVGPSWVSDHDPVTYMYKTELDAFGSRSDCAVAKTAQEVD